MPIQKHVMAGELIDAGSSIDLPLEQPGFFERLHRTKIDKQAEKNCRAIVLQGQLVALKDNIRTEVAINREVCRSNFEQIMIIFRENVERARNESEVKRAKHVAELFSELAKDFDEFMDTIQRVKNEVIRKRLEAAMEARIELVISHINK